jgi:hypothetical protein
MTPLHVNETVDEDHLKVKKISLDLIKIRLSPSFIYVLVHNEEF